MTFTLHRAKGRRSHAPRAFLLAVVSLFAFAIVSSPVRADAADFTVTVSDVAFAYVISGSVNPPLNLVRGRTYTFAVDAVGHPFYIKTAQVPGSGSTFDTGVTNNGAQSGTLTFAVPASAPATLFYQCGVHAEMTGPIHITNPPAAPAVGLPGFVLLFVGFMAAAVFTLRRRHVTS
jgi:hypothetical protein